MRWSPTWGPPQERHLAPEKNQGFSGGFQCLLATHSLHLEKPDMVVRMVTGTQRAIAGRAVHPIAAPDGELGIALEVHLASDRIFGGRQHGVVFVRHDLEGSSGEFCMVTIWSTFRDAGLHSTLKAVGATVPCSFPVTR